MDDFNLEQYLSHGVENIVKGALKASLSNPKESVFMAKYAIASKKARMLRMEAEKNGEHIPPFLIASIASTCNLHCAGCYSRANHACEDKAAVDQLTDDEWFRIFNEAKEMGVGFILLAGGEPLLRPDIIHRAGKIPDILFPVFTNGTLINETYIETFSKYRNVVPVLSIEGNETITDERRGKGVYDKLIQVMKDLQKNKILYGASITVTKSNMMDVTNEKFLHTLHDRGCKVLFYVEYVPVTEETRELAPGDTEREYLNQAILRLRKEYEDIVFVSFPGDEKTSGGCLAAGRGFFHINSHGGAEPCPFSPYSDVNVKNGSIRDALASPLFLRLQAANVLLDEHAGGCVLFEKREKVEELLNVRN